LLDEWKHLGVNCWFIWLGQRLDEIIFALIITIFIEFSN